jgi:hypothetical protein
MELFSRKKVVNEKDLGNNKVLENGQIIVVKKADKFLPVRKGGGIVRKEGGEDNIVKGGSNPDAYKDYIDY